MLLTEKYAPKSVDSMIGNDDARAYVKQWMLNCLAGNKRKALIVHGPPGIGKTTLAYALAEQYDLEVIEMNASELRNKKRVERVLAGATMASTLTGRGKLLLIDDVDVLAGRKDSGGGSAIAAVLKDGNVPAIVTATDIWDKKVAPIRNSCEAVALKKVGKIPIKKLLERVAKKEGIEMSEPEIDGIATESAGDVRSALNDLQARRKGGRDREKDIFNRVRQIFKAQKYAEAKEAMFGDVDYELVKLWIDENIPNEYETTEDIAAAYNILSRADMFEGRIRKSNWQLLRYSIDLSTAGVALAKKKPYYKFTKYSFPGYLRDMSATVIRRAMRKRIGIKIGAVVHSNSRDSLEYVPLIQAMAKDDGESVSEFYDFEEDELAFIMETSVRNVKTKKTQKS
ncbi:MAG: replication factor C large subunit [Candidatus Micrarchaeota archaeon]